MADFKIKRGDYFELLVVVSVDGALVDLTGWTARSQARSSTDALVYEFPVAIPDPTNSTVYLTADQAITEGWAVGVIFCDVEVIDPDGRKTSSETFTIEVEKDITKNAP